MKHTLYEKTRYEKSAAALFLVLFTVNALYCSEGKESKFPQSSNERDGSEQHQPSPDPKIIKHPDGSVSYPTYNKNGRQVGWNWRPAKKPEKRTGADHR